MVLEILSEISDFIWDLPMILLLVGTGIVLTIGFRGYYNFRRWRFHFAGTFGKMFKKAEGTGTVSGFAAACTAMANTIGVGNIGGVATAIVSGGPGAIFWMWLSGLLGMSTKACEIILGQRYRVKYSHSMDEYMCDRSFVMKNALGWKKGAFVLAAACFLLGPWTCSVQTESVTGSLKEGFGVSSARLTTVAFKHEYGAFGGWFMAIAITVFAWTTIIGMYYSCEKSVNYLFGDTLRNKAATKVYMIYYMIPCVVLYNSKADVLWAMTDLLSAIYVLITITFIVLKHKEIFRLHKDFWNRYIKAKESGEDPAPVVYGVPTKEQ